MQSTEEDNLKSFIDNPCDSSKCLVDSFWTISVRLKLKKAFYSKLFKFTLLQVHPKESATSGPNAFCSFFL